MRELPTSATVGQMIRVIGDAVELGRACKLSALVFAFAFAFDFDSAAAAAACEDVDDVDDKVDDAEVERTSMKAFSQVSFGPSDAMEETWILICGLALVLLLLLRPLLSILLLVSSSSVSSSSPSSSSLL